MHKHTHTELSSLIVLLSIATIVCQFITYYYIASSWLVFGISALLTCIFHHIVVEQTQSYQVSFDLSLMTVFISFLVLVLTYFGDNQSLIDYSTDLIGLVFINWLIPNLYGYIRSMFDRSGRVEDFSIFYRNSSLLFIVFYAAILAYGYFSPNAFPRVYHAMIKTSNFTPFVSMATQIEDYLNHILPLQDVIVYIGCRILAFVPYGYFITLLVRRKAKYVRWILFLLPPILIEGIQYLLITQRCNIDDAIYGFVGGALGTLCFFLSNLIYRSISGQNFLASAADYRYSKHSLHF